jgi:hypothetical protein
MEELDIDVLHCPIDILKSDDVKDLAAAIAAYGGYVLVIIDTLAQVTPGANENTAEDMSKALANIKAVQQATGSTVLVIHHAGKDASRGSRGWSGLKAAAEAQIEIVRDEETGKRHIHLDKMKDGEDGLRMGFRLDVLMLDVDEDGDPVTSCVIREDDMAPAAPKEDMRGIRKRGKMVSHILDVISTLPSNQATMNLDRFVQRCADSLPPPEQSKPDTRRQRVKRAVDTMARDRSEDAPLMLDGNTVVFLVE